MWYVERWWEFDPTMGVVDERQGPFETEEAAKAACPPRWQVRYSKEPLDVGIVLDNP